MRTIAIINLKGGVGKTTTAVNVATILAERHGKKVLVIDADPQANTTQFFGLKGENCHTIAEILDGMSCDVEDCIYETRVPGVYLIPSCIDLIECDIASVRGSDSCGIRRIREVCAYIHEENFFNELAGANEVIDYAIIDCPPSFTAASVASIYASDDVIIPVKIDAYALGGMAQLMAQIANVQNIQPGIRIAGILVTMWHDSPAVVQGEELLRKAGLPVFRQHIRISDKVDESTFALQSLEAYSPRSAAGVDYRRFVAEYLGEVR